MRVYLLMFFLLLMGCAENDEEKIENIKLNKNLAEELVSYRLNVLTRNIHIK